MSEGLMSFADQYGPINLGKYGDTQAWIGLGSFPMQPPTSFAYTQMISTGKIPQDNYSFNVKPNTEKLLSKPVILQTPILTSYQTSASYHSGIYEVAINGTVSDINGVKNITGFVHVSFINAQWYPYIAVVHGVFGATTVIIAKFGSNGVINIDPNNVNGKAIYSSVQYTAAWL
jgi:hypothetical protein